MTPAERSPTVRRRRLAARLIELREQAGYTVREAAQALKIAESTLYRVENRERGVKPGDVLLILQLYGQRVTVTDEERDRLVQLARDARKRGWWQNYGAVTSRSLSEYIGLEDEADSLRTYETELVPGLLQTERYAREVRRAYQALTAGADDADTDRWIELRLRRQQRLTEPEPTRLWAVLNEGVLRREVGGPEVMAEQLDHLADLARLPNVIVQVLGFTAGAHAAMGAPFMILGFPELAHPDVIYFEHAAQQVHLEEASDVRWYTLAFDHLRAQALDPDRSLTLVRRVAEEHRATRREA